MLLTNRRHRLIYVMLAGMEVAWFLPFALLLVGWLARSLPAAQFLMAFVVANSATALFVLLWTTLLCYIFFADLLNRRQIESPLRELALLLLLVVTSLAAIRLLLYRDAALDDAGWLVNSASAVFNFANRLRPELAIILVNFFLWLRVTAASDRGLSFFSVGVSFRLGMLLAILGNGLMTTWGGVPAVVGVQLFAYFFTCGLIAVALARVDDKAMGGANSSGALLPWSRLLQIMAASLLVVMVALGVARFFSAAFLRSVLGWFSPLWSAIGWLFAQASLLIFYLLAPIIEWLINAVRGMMGEMPVQEMELGPVGERPSLAQVVREWDALRYCLVIGAIVLALALLWLLFARSRQRKRMDEAESTDQLDMELGGGLLAAGWQKLRDWLNLMQRYGLSGRLLAAISVQNIYANLGRIARERGYARRPSQPPDAYLVDLRLAFPDHEDDLAVITAAYMRVHYGDQPVEANELDDLRERYTRLTAPPEQE